MPLHWPRPPAPPAVARFRTDAAQRGFERIVTSALGPSDRDALLAGGFDVLEPLHLLRRALDVPLPATPSSVSTQLRRARRSEWPGIVAVDRDAFEPFWHLDAAGIADALHATPSSRLRVAVVGDELSGYAVSGYAVFGRSGTRGYVQRLAVHPTQAGHGLGRALLLDGLRWLQARGVRQAWVNTQERNARALDLYQRHGFELEPEGLAVLHAAAEPPS